MAGSVRISQAGVYTEVDAPVVVISRAGTYTEYSASDSVGGAVFISVAGIYTEYGAETEPPVDPPVDPSPPQPSANREPTFHAHLDNPDFSPLINPRFELRPVRWSWIRPGGCDRAEVAVIGSERNVWNQLPSLLRAPITIYNQNQSVLWWGYVHEVQLYANDMVVGLSLDGLYNRVAVAFNNILAGSTSGTPDTTAWVQDDDSVDRFGQREILSAYGDATTTQAEAVRDGILSSYRYVLPDTRPGSANHSATLICRGWYCTLNWQYYANSGTTSTLISDQVSDIVAGAGQFFAGSDIVTAHDISSNEYRDGTLTALEIVNQLLQTPLSTGERMTGWVTPERLLRFDAEGSSGNTDWLLLPNQQFRHYLGGVPDPGREILGWTQLRGVLPASNWGYMLSPSPVYIEENEFDAAALRYTWRARGAQSPWG